MPMLPPVSDNPIILAIKAPIIKPSIWYIISPHRMGCYVKRYVKRVCHPQSHPSVAVVLAVVMVAAVPMACFVIAMANFATSFKADFDLADSLSVFNVSALS